MALRILLLIVLLALPGFGQDENLWNVYCNGDSSRCTVAKEPSGEFTFSIFSTPVTWDEAWAWMSENGFPAQPGEWNVYCNGDRSRCTVAKEPSGELMFAVFSTPVTWNDAWAWMTANGFPAQPAVWNVYCNGDRSKCAVANEQSGDLIFSVFSIPVTWDQAWSWMRANGYSAIDDNWIILAPINANMVLTQSGNRITGTYSFDQGQGSIEGTLSGQNVWSGTWSDPTGNGDFSVTFSDDARSFQGNWKYSASTNWDGVFEGEKP